MRVFVITSQYVEAKMQYCSMKNAFPHSISGNLAEQPGDQNTNYNKYKVNPQCTFQNKSWV